MAVNLMDNLELLVTQYQAAPKLKGIIAGLLQLIQQQQLDPLYQFEAGLALDHATGWSLDRIGHNHGLPRPIANIEGSGYFGFDKGGKNFNQVPFYYGAKDKLQPLGDASYRTLLKVWLRRLFYDGSSYGLTKLLTEALQHPDGTGGGYVTDHENLKVTVTILEQNRITFEALCGLPIIPKTAGIHYDYVLVNKGEKPYPYKPPH